MKRTHTCGELRREHDQMQVTLAGWVAKIRHHGGIAFINLRDRYGITQIVAHKSNEQQTEILNSIGREYVLQVHGKVRKRPDKDKNKELETGDIELDATKIVILNTSDPLPLELDDFTSNSDEIRQRYRYLDLRRPIMQERLRMRHQVMQAMREFLSQEQFLEIETPLLIKSMPEGARDFIVPSRLHPGKFYSLPQSPQLYKQLLMVSGCDRYYQFARCLRDEDLREDRQPEFTQLDLEMSFVDEEDIYEMMERMFVHTVKEVLHKDLKVPFPRLTYYESMDKYGCDKPDLRFGLELQDYKPLLGQMEVSFIQSAEHIRGLVIDKVLSRKELKACEEVMKPYGAAALGWIKKDTEGLSGPLVKFASEALHEEIVQQFGDKEGMLLFVAGSAQQVYAPLAALRNHLGKKLELIDKDALAFCWITDFPLFEKDEETGQWIPMHHIFTMPQEECMEYLKTDPSKVVGKLYDTVLNGVELASGSIRIHDQHVQRQVLELLGMDYKEIEHRFGFLVDAFKYGAPPHGGIAYGFERVVSLFCGFNDIKEVVAFPKTKSMECLTDGCPSMVDQVQLEEAHIHVVKSSDKSKKEN